MDYEALLMTKCKICEGHKYIYGMGNVREKCQDCEGKGFISKAVQNAKLIEKQKKDKKGNIDV